MGDLITHDLLAQEAQVLADGTPTDGSGYGSLSGYYDPPIAVGPYQASLRVQILRGRQENRNKSRLSVLTPELADTMLRAAVDRNESTDWYALYLLSLILEPTTEDEDRLMTVLNRCEVSARVVAVDVLYLWGDTSGFARSLRQGRIRRSQVGDRLGSGRPALCRGGGAIGADLGPLECGNHDCGTTFVDPRR